MQIGEVRMRMRGSWLDGLTSVMEKISYFLSDLLVWLSCGCAGVCV